MQYTFKPPILLSAFCFVLFVLFLSLGIWQLDRASEKEQQKIHIDGKTQQTPTSLNRFFIENKPSASLTPYQPVNITGRYRTGEQFLLDNIIHQGKPGYYVLSPFSIKGSEKVILVNRGWVPQGRDRKILPDIGLTENEQHLSGSLSEPRSKPVVLGSIDQPMSDNPPLWYYMDITVFETQAGYQVLPLILKLAPDPTSKLVREWPKFEAKSGMHIGYAIQWFVFALFVLIAFLGISIKNNKKGNIDD